MLTPTTRLGRFTLRSPLGAGAMGVVYRAFDGETGAEVALKTMPHTSPEHRLLLKQEFRVLRDVSHPNLVQLHDLVVEGDQAFFTMELIEGVDLLTWIRGQRSAPEAPTGTLPPPGVGEADTLPPPGNTPLRAATPAPQSSHGSLDEAGLARLAQALPQLLRGLGALHRRGLVHRDVKPSNLKVTPEGRVVLLDFGLTAAAEEAEVGVVVGTVTHMAPEQAAGEPPGAAADLYSVGVMLWQALTGRLPFEGDDPVRRAARRHEAAPTPPIDPEVPAHLAALAAALLAPDPEARPDVEAALALARVEQALVQAPEVVVLAGRGDALGTLERALAEVVETGQPVLIEVQGPSGTGKSTLLRHVCARAASERGAWALSARCDPREAVPYKALDAAVDQLTRLLAACPRAERRAIWPSSAPALAPLFPALGRLALETMPPVPPASDPVEQRRQGVEAFRALMAAVARRWPLILWIDDVQWADLDSVPLIKALLQPQTDAPPALIIFSRRTEEAPGPLAPEILGVQPRALELGPLGEAAAEELIRRLAPDATPAVVQRAVTEAGGSPYLLSEYARALTSRAADDAPLGGLEAVLQRRLAGLSSPARAVVIRVAVAAGPLPRDVAVDADEASQGASSLAGLLADGLLRPAAADGATVQVFHDQVRAAALATLSAGDLQAAHRALYEALEHHPRATPEGLAEHAWGASDPEGVAHWGRVAGERALAALAFEQAARHLGRALRAGEPASEGHLDLLRSFARATGATGRSAEAAEAFLEAAADTQASAAHALADRRQAAELLIGAGQLDRGLDVLGEVLRSAGMTLHTGPRAMTDTLYWRARLRLRGLRYTPTAPEAVPPAALNRVDVCWTVAGSLGFFHAVPALGFQTRHVLLALEAGEPGRIARALAMEFVYLAAGGKAPARVADLQRQIEALEAGGLRPEIEAFLLLSRGYVDFLSGRPARASERLEQAAARYSTLGAARWERNLCRTHILFALAYRGELAALAARLPSAVEDFETIGDQASASALALGAGFFMHLAADDPERARRDIDQHLAHWGAPLPQAFLYMSLLARGCCDFYEGRAAETLDRVTAQRRALQLVLTYQNVRIWVAWYEGLAAAHQLILSTEPRAPLLKHLNRAQRLISKEQVSWGDALAGVLSAARARADGHLEAAATAIEAAAPRFTEAGMGAFADVAHWRAAIWRGDDEAAASAVSALRSRGIQRPDRWALMCAPPE